MAESFDSSKKKRNLIKLRLSNTEQYFVQNAEEAEDYVTIQIRKQQFDEAKAIYYQLQNLIVETCAPEFLEQKSEEMLQMDERVCQVEIIWANLLKKLNVNVISMVNDRVINAEHSEIKSKVKLPDLRLPSFSGSFNEWVDFRNTFTALIADDKTLSDTHKLQYLRSCLKGEAINIQSQEESYQSLWGALKSMYENERYIINKHIEELLEIKIMANNSAIDLRNIINQAKKHHRILSSLGYDMGMLTIMFIIHLVTNKLDYSIRKEFELSMKPGKLPDWEYFITYLEVRLNTLESFTNQKKVGVVQSKLTPKPSPKIYTATDTQEEKNKTSKPNCFVCQKQHYLSNCEQFLKANYEKRMELVKQHKLCFNCLSKSHRIQECKSSSCKTCNRRHHTLLHSEQSTSTEVIHFSTFNKQVILNTAVIRIFDANGKVHFCRCLLDSGAMSNFISQSLVDILQLKPTKLNIRVSGINNTNTNVKHKVRTDIGSRISNYKNQLDFLVVPKLTELPTRTFNQKDCKIPNYLPLADPHFNKILKIDMILGMAVYNDIFTNNEVKLQNGLTARNTQFGYVIGGQIKSQSTSNTQFCGLVSNEEIHSQLKNFWELTEVKTSKIMSVEEQSVEQHFQETHFRYKDGRYGVYIPFKSNSKDLGNSKEIALKRFLILERKLNANKALKVEYNKFMDDYIKLNHMELVKQSVKDHEAPDAYFIPHHAVLKNSDVKKIRVVFDASAVSSSGLSLNAVMKSGPVVQNDFINILIRFRFHRFAFSCDIKKMYRQIRIHSTHRRCQSILWRNLPSEPISVYQLCTVTYGTAIAPYLATRSLIQLSIDEEQQFPLAADVLRNDTYVDDCLTGANTLQDAQVLKTQLVQMLELGKFELHKWCSNTPELLSDISEEHQEQNKTIGEESTVKTLGLEWNTENDTFVFKFSQQTSNKTQITKRTVLSDVARYFDPLGITEPINFSARILMQRLWQKGYDWDDVLDEEDQLYWTQHLSQRYDDNDFTINRCVISRSSEDSPVQMQLHGFCDASMLGYGAVLYLRTVWNSGDITSELLCSKSRVAPLKSITIPKLELCGALLLARLMSNVKSAIPEHCQVSTYYWCDSTIVLAWIRLMSKNLKTFVAHRVAEIQTLTNISEWRYIKTSDNPADIVSRGTTPKQLKHNQLWWNGSSFLVKREQDWFTEKQLINYEEIPEQKTSIFVASTIEKSELFDKYSSYTRLLYTVAWIKRFISNIRSKKQSVPKNFGHLSISELQESEKTLIKRVQEEEFSEEIHCLRKKKSIDIKSKIINLSPFLDSSGIMRVGGRLAHSSLAYETIHQIILPHSHTFTTLLIRHHHIQNIHAQQQLLLSTLRRKFWILSGRSATRKVVRNCLQCFKSKAKPLEQQMGQLPEYRIKPAAPFLISGVDYCGPFLIRGNIRGNVKVKTYIAVFTCMTTRAIHLELAADQSTPSFINVLHRFVSRRGLPNKLLSDNATTFHGANNELKKMFSQWQNDNHIQEIKKFCDAKQINWSMIPPRTPHMGGAWESAVKLTKTHLYKIFGSTLLSFEEFSTIVTRIEAVLNSRPITKVHDDHTDYLALTPGHFIIGRPLNDIVEPDLCDFKLSRLSRFQYLTRLKQEFWKRWSLQYLQQLQQRHKWHSVVKVQLGQIVIIMEDNIPSSQWILGKIIHLYIGTDGITRVVKLKTKTGELVRPLVKLCLLPIEDNDSN